MKQWRITFHSYGRKAQCPSNPDYPHGKDIDTGERPACLASLPYPAKEVGMWFIHCKRCKVLVAVTAAGRPDDPRSIMIPCKETPQ